MGNLIAHGSASEASLAHSSPLMKLPIRPAARPSGAVGTRKSATWRKGRPHRHEKNQIPSTTPMAPPWKLIPPSQTRMMLPGFARKFTGS